ncbi:MAG: DEAD/DEAH box helicase [Treponema sp.]|jgi:superfamily II DNA/RNA helicase|nr:DEAD/DEAH box helicase [Treponema sp.]
MADSFSGLGVAPFFVERLGERDIRVPTAIQALIIPRLLLGENILFRSATGTGKTFAYLIPLFQNLLGLPSGAAGGPADSGPGTAGGKGPLILILAPTYELCSQIKQEADFLLRAYPGGTVPAHPPKASLIIGSAQPGRQIETLKKDRPAVLVGNPGRLLHLARMGKLRLGGVRALVLDEGDRLVADELLGETRDLAALVNPDRITAACSATMGLKSRERLLPLMGTPVAGAETEDREILRDRIIHWALFSEGRRKIATLRSFIAAVQPRKALVFTGQGWDVGNIVSQLQHHQLAAVGLYGDMDKRKRKAALDDFRRDRARILVSSDLAARGLDIPGISHIIALDLPPGPEAYIHRSGRTARAGKRGLMVTIGDEEELRRLAVLEKKLGITVYPKVLSHGGIHAPA